MYSIRLLLFAALLLVTACSTDRDATALTGEELPRPSFPASPDGASELSETGGVDLTADDAGSTTADRGSTVESSVSADSELVDWSERDLEASGPVEFGDPNARWSVTGPLHFPLEPLDDPSYDLSLIHI